MATFGQINKPVQQPTISSGQIVQQLNSRLQSVESAIRTIGKMIGSNTDNSNIGGSIFARITYLHGKIFYELANAENNTTLLNAAGKTYYAPTTFDAGIIDRANQSTNVRLALRDLDHSAAALGTNRFDGTSNATTDDYNSYSLASGNINSSSSAPNSIPRHIGIVRDNPYQNNNNRAASYDPESKFGLPNRIVRHGATVKEALESINEVIGDVGESASFQYMGTFTSYWMDNNMTIKACFEKLAEKIDAIETGGGVDPDLLNKITTNETRIVQNETAIAQEIQTREANDTSIQNNLTNEINARIQLDTEVRALITQESKTREDDDDELDTKISTEKTNRENADNALQGNINNEQDARIQLDTDLRALIAQETKTREDEDDALQTNIDNNLLTLNQTIQGINTNLTAEQTNRENADTVLQNNINTEIISRQDEDTLIRQSITNETTQRQDADSNLTQLINAEKLRAEGVENGILTNTVPNLQQNINTNANAIAANQQSLDGINLTIGSTTGYVQGKANIVVSINDLHTLTTNNEQKVSDNEGLIAVNLTNIGANTSSIGANTTNIGANTTNIGANTTTSASNTSLINTNTTNIEANTTNIDANTTNIAANTTNIGANTTTNASNTTLNNTNTTNIGALNTFIGTSTGYTSTKNDLVEAINDIHTFTQDLTVGDSELSLQNKSRIDNIIGNTDPAALDSLTEIVQSFQNADGNIISTIGDTSSFSVGDTLISRIVENTTNISTNAGAIQTNTNNISRNVTSITNNANAIDTNVSAISTNVNAIDTNTGTIQINTNNISGNVSNITNNANAIGTNANAIGTNVNAIDTNANVIAGNASGIAANTNEITTIKNDIGSRAVIVSGNTIVDEINLKADTSAVSGLTNQINNVSQTGITERNNIRTDIGTITGYTSTKNDIVSAINDLQTSHSSLTSIHSLPWTSDLIPQTSTQSVGSVEKQVESIYLKKIWLNDIYLLQINANNLTTLSKRKNSVAPESIIALQGSYSGAQTFSGTTSLSLAHWLQYYIHLSGNSNATIYQVFGDNDFESIIVLNDIETLKGQQSDLTAKITTVEGDIGSTSQLNANFQSNTLVGILNELYTTSLGIASNTQTLQNIISNTDASALDSLTEIVAAFQTTDQLIGDSTKINNSIIDEIVLNQQTNATNQTNINNIQTKVGNGTLDSDLDVVTTINAIGTSLVTVDTALTILENGQIDNGGNIATNASNLTSEINRATASENALSTKINTVEGLIRASTTEVLDSEFTNNNVTTIIAALNYLAQNGGNVDLTQVNAAIAANQTSIQNILTNTDPAALDSLAELANAIGNMNNLQGDLVTKILANETSVTALQSLVGTGTLHATFDNSIDSVVKALNLLRTDANTAYTTLGHQTTTLNTNYSSVVSAINQMTTAIDGKVNTSTYNSGISALEQADATEKARAEGVESQLDAKITTNTNTLTSKTNQSDFVAVRDAVNHGTTGLSTRASQSDLTAVVSGIASDSETLPYSSTTVFGAINTLKTNIDSNTSNVSSVTSTVNSQATKITTLETAMGATVDSQQNSLLTTSNKTVIGGINEINADIGDMGDLTISNDIVSAINIIYGAASGGGGGNSGDSFQTTLNKSNIETLQTLLGSNSITLDNTYTSILQAINTIETQRKSTTSLLVGENNIDQNSPSLNSPHSHVVGAINTISGDLGSDSISGTVKGNIVSILSNIATLQSHNSNTRLGTLETIVGTINNPSTGNPNLLTTDKTLIGGINEIHGSFSSVKTKVGEESLTSPLTTLTAAVNSFHTGKVDTSTFSALNATVTDPNNGLGSKVGQDTFNVLNSAVNHQTTGLSTKVSQDDFSTFASSTEDDLASLQSSINAKANQTDLTSLSAIVNHQTTGLNTKAPQTTVDSLTTVVNTKVAQSAFDTLNASIIDSNSGLSSKVSQSDFDVLNETVNHSQSGLFKRALQTDLASLQTTVSAKANQSDLTTLTSVVNHETTGLSSKSSQSNFLSLQSTVNGKANQSDLTTLNSVVNHQTTGLTTKASQTSLDSLTSVVNTKVDQSTFDVLNNLVTHETTGLTTKVSQSDFNTLNSTVSDSQSGLASKAPQSALDSLATTVNAKVNQSAFDTLNTSVTNQGAQLTSLNDAFTNLTQQTPEALDTLNEIIQAFQAADASLNTLVTNLGSSKADQSALDTLNATISDSQTGLISKASQSSLDSLTATVNTKVDQSVFDALNSIVNHQETGLSTKVSQSVFNTLNSIVTNSQTGLTSKASQSSLDSLTTTVNGKVSQSDFNTLNSSVSSLTSTVNTKVSQSDFDVLNASVNDSSTGLLSKAPLASLNALDATVNHVTTGLSTKASQFSVNTLTTAVNGKVAQSEFDTLNASVTDANTGLSTKASQSSVNTLTTAVNGKVAQSDFDTLNATVTDANTGLSTKAPQSSVDTLTTTVNGKVSQSDFNTLNSTVTDANTGLSTKAPLTALDGKVDVSTFNSAIADLNTLLGSGGSSSAANTAAINLINQTLGSDSLQTTSQTVKGAINEVAGKMSEDMSLVYANIKEAVVDISYVDRSSSLIYNGSGWLYNNNGNMYIVTAAHVGQDYNETSSSVRSRYSNQIFCTILNYNNTGKNVTLPCIPIGADSRADIMVLVPYNGTSRITHHKSLQFGDSRANTPGSDCLVIGYAKGFDSNSCSAGVIRDNKFVFVQGVETMFVSAPGVGGNSGGPIVDKQGKVIGLFTFGWTNEETLGGGAAQFVLEPVVKKLIASGEAGISNLSSTISSLVNNTHSTYEYPKISFNCTALTVQTSDIISIPNMQGINPSIDRHGIRLSNVSSPSLFQNSDIIQEITYTPTDSIYDPNYNGGNPVTIKIGEHESSITNVTWFLTSSNISTLSVKVVRNNSILNITNFAIGGNITFMTEAQDRYLSNSMTTADL